MTLDKIVGLYTDFGQVALPAAAVLYALYKKDYNGAAWFALSIVVNQVGIEVLKRVFNTTRPNGKAHAFPSGHTAAAFLAPCFFMVRYALPATTPLVASSFVFATAVGIGRVWVQAHWPCDVVGGVALAFATIQVMISPWG